jgi:hypothetical protein
VVGILGGLKTLLVGVFSCAYVIMLFICREWIEDQSLHETNKTNYRSCACGGHRGWVHIEFPLHLQQEIPKFDVWLKLHVKAQLTVGAKVDEDVVWLSRPPVHKAWTYESMWVYGNHYHMDPKIGPMHVMYDFGVACIFK